MYKWGYAHGEKIRVRDFHAVKGCLLVVSLNKWAKQTIKEGHFVKTKTPGVYSLRNGTVDFFVVVDELKLNMENLGLLLNSTAPKLTKVLAFARKSGFLDHSIMESYLYSKCFLIGDSEDEALMTEVKKILKHKHEKGIRNAVEIIGLEKVIESVGLEKVVDTLGLEKLVDSADNKNLVSHILKKMGKEKLLEHVEEEEKR